MLIKTFTADTERSHIVFISYNSKKMHATKHYLPPTLRPPGNVKMYMNPFPPNEMRTLALAIKHTLTHIKCVSPALAIKCLGVCIFSLLDACRSRISMLQRKRLRKLALVCCLLIEVRHYFYILLRAGCSITDLLTIYFLETWLTLFFSVVGFFFKLCFEFTEV